MTNNGPVQAIGFKISGKRVKNGNKLKNIPTNPTMYHYKASRNDSK